VLVGALPYERLRGALRGRASRAALFRSSARAKAWKRMTPPIARCAMSYSSDGGQPPRRQRGSARTRAKWSSVSWARWAPRDAMDRGSLACGVPRTAGITDAAPGP
jgi:hypothetical protein